VDLFQKMPEPDVISGYSTIVGYAQNGHANETLKLFETMLPES
jgi:hypothetical protein